jgi:DNA invertase Pin-like site-specific DNA recombinase
MKYGYARVSSLSQTANYSLENQREALLNYGVPETNVFIEAYTGTTFDRPKLEELERLLQPGDTLVVAHIDRLGRNLADLITFINKLEKQNIDFVPLNFPECKDKTMRWMFLTIFGALAEWENTRRRERQMEGIAKAKLDPEKYKGRKTVITPHMKKEIQEDMMIGRPITRIAERLGVSRSTVYQALKQINQEKRQKAQALEKQAAQV